MYISQYFASEEASNEDLFSVLGVDWSMLAFQTIAFILLVWLLGKFVFPWLIKSIDDRQAKIQQSLEAAAAAQKEADGAEKRIKKMLAGARDEARDIIEQAKRESINMLEATEQKSRQRADQIAADAKEQIEKDILAAKSQLRDEMKSIVSIAVEKIAGKVVSAQVNEKMVSETLKDIK